LTMLSLRSEAKPENESPSLADNLSLTFRSRATCELVRPRSGVCARCDPTPDNGLALLKSKVRLNAEKA
jgi:hypothetical protein